MKSKKCNVFHLKNKKIMSDDELSVIFLEFISLWQCSWETKLLSFLLLGGMVEVHPCARTLSSCM